jgi:hypothetical protein
MPIRLRQIQPGGTRKGAVQQQKAGNLTWHISMRVLAAVGVLAGRGAQQFVPFAGVNRRI